MAERFRRYEFNGVALIVAGFVLVALVVAGYFIGAFIDHRLHTGQRWAFVGLVIGFLLGFWDLYVVSSHLLAEQPKFTPLPVPDEEQSACDDDNDDEHGTQETGGERTS